MSAEDSQSHAYAVVSCKVCKRLVAYDGEIRTCPHCKSTPLKFTSFQLMGKRPEQKPDPAQLMGG